MVRTEHSLTVGPVGPIVLNDFHPVERMANFNRERIPEHQPHAKGGAFGYFEVTADVGAYPRAAVFQPGTTTDTLIRFSTAAPAAPATRWPKIAVAGRAVEKVRPAVGPDARWR
jgi:catalase